MNTKQITAKLNKLSNDETYDIVQPIYPGDLSEKLKALLPPDKTDLIEKKLDRLADMFEASYDRTGGPPDSNRYYNGVNSLENLIQKVLQGAGVNCEVVDAEDDNIIIIINPKPHYNNKDINE